MLDLSLASGLWHIIQVALWIGIIEINRRRNLAVMHGDQCRCDSRSSARALRVPNLGLECRHRRAVRAISQRQLQRPRLDAIIELRRSAVKIDIIDLLSRNTSFFHRKLNRSRRLLATFCQPYAMKGLTRGTVSRDLGIDTRSPSSRMLVLLKHE